jgi:hypothetical protein
MKGSIVMNLPMVQLVLGIAVLSLGVFNWRSGGKTLATLGIANAALGVFLMLPESGWRYAALGLAAGGVLLAFVSASGESWRRSAPVLTLLAATMMAIVMSFFLTNIPPTLQNGLLIVVSILAVASVVLLVRLASQFLTLKLDSGSERK